MSKILFKNKLVHLFNYTKSLAARIHWWKETAPVIGYSSSCITKPKVNASSTLAQLTDGL